VAYLNLGDAQFKAGDAKAAERAYRTYLELAPQGAGAAHVRKQLGLS
jgi:predicted TPR repeat methyltransferase